MKKISERKALQLLNKYKTSQKAYKIILKHALAVKKLALKISKNIPNLDRGFIATASILHDIGRFQYPPKKQGIKHGVEGAKILRKEGLFAHARVAERHVGSGITKSEAKKLGLPEKSYLPKTKEEKIICYADSLIFGTRQGTLKQVLARYEKEVGKTLVNRTIKLHEEIERMKRGSNIK